MKKQNIIFIGFIVILILLTIFFYFLTKINKTNVTNQTNQTNSINTTDSSFTGSISSSGLTVTPGNSRPVDLIQDEQLFQKNKHPDVFLHNHVPYATNNFSITSDFVKSKDHFQFIITVPNSNQNPGKQAALDWIKGQGLDDQQIASLDIVYHTSNN